MHCLVLFAEESVALEAVRARRVELHAAIAEELYSILHPPVPAKPPPDPENADMVRARVASYFEGSRSRPGYSRPLSQLVESPTVQLPVQPLPPSAQPIPMLMPQPAPAVPQPTPSPLQSSPSLPQAAVPPAGAALRSSSPLQTPTLQELPSPPQTPQEQPSSPPPSSTLTSQRPDHTDSRRSPEQTQESTPGLLEKLLETLPEQPTHAPPMDDKNSSRDPPDPPPPAEPTPVLPRTSSLKFAECRIVGSEMVKKSFTAYICQGRRSNVSAVLRAFRFSPFANVFPCLFAAYFS